MSITASRWRENPIGRSIRILSIRDRRKVFAATILQVLLSGLDLLGVLAIGLLGTLSLTNQNSESSILQVQSTLKLLGISNFDYHSQLIIIGGFARIKYTLDTGEIVHLIDLINLT